MKKRQKTYPSDPQINQISQKSNDISRNSQSRLTPTGPGSFQLNFTDRPKSLAPQAFEKFHTDTSELLIDEFPSAELKKFAHCCIDSLQSTASTDTNVDLQRKLKRLAVEQLPSYTALILEHCEANSELKQLVARSKRFIAKARPQLEQTAIEPAKISDIKLKVLQDIELCMGAKLRVKNLNKRINRLIHTVSSILYTTGEELNLPDPIMQKIAEHLQKTLIKE